MKKKTNLRKNIYTMKIYGIRKEFGVNGIECNEQTPVA